MRGEQPAGRRISKIGEKVIHYDIKSPILDNNYPEFAKSLSKRKGFCRIPGNRAPARPPAGSYIRVTSFNAKMVLIIIFIAIMSIHPSALSMVMISLSGMVIPFEEYNPSFFRAFIL